MAGDAKDRRVGSNSALGLEFRVYAVERLRHCRPPKGGTPSIFARSPARLERAVQRKRTVRRAAILVVADVSAVEIELSVGLIAGLSSERDDPRNLPVKTSTGPNVAVCYHRMVELGHSMRVAECIVGSEGCFCDSRACIKRHITA